MRRRYRPAMGAGIQVRRLRRRELDELVSTLCTWETPGGYPLGLHVGDVGWHARLPDEQLTGTVRVLEQDAVVVAAGLFEPGLARPRLAPGYETDAAVCAAVADEIEGDPDEQVWSDAAPGSLLRTTLSARGWTLDPEPWVALYRPLSATDAGLGDALVRPVNGTQDVADRVAVQRSAFEGSTFTVEAWHRMAATTAYHPALDLLARESDGAPVAAATGWSAGPGRCAILEPVGTHPEHRGGGHGRRVVLAALGALARAGASGVTVHTPADNGVAVAAYEACGLRRLHSTEALMRDRQANTKPTATA
jgi:ribosomal protein S18 acetylase RimI-like enzyme